MIFSRSSFSTPNLLLSPLPCVDSAPSALRNPWSGTLMGFIVAQAAQVPNRSNSLEGAMPNAAWRDLSISFKYLSIQP